MSSRRKRGAAITGATYRVKDVAQLSGVTVRALHHYDAIGLLPPSGRTRAGYRVYTPDDLVRLQQILVGRELGLSLEEIRGMLGADGDGRLASLERHREQLLARIDQTNAMIRAIDRTIAHLRGGTAMTTDDMFDGFDPKKYEKEAKERWGNTDAFRESQRRTKGYSKEDWARFKQEGAELIEKLRTQLASGASPGDPAVLDLAEAHRLQIDEWFYPCSYEIHVGLGEMYVADERFTAHYDQHAPGLAQFLSSAIRLNAARRGYTKP